jgi:hypothetical protein
VCSREVVDGLEGCESVEGAVSASVVVVVEIVHEGVGAVLV